MKLRSFVAMTWESGTGVLPWFGINKVVCLFGPKNCIMSIGPFHRPELIWLDGLNVGGSISHRQTCCGKAVVYWVSWFLWRVINDGSMTGHCGIPVGVGVLLDKALLKHTRNVLEVKKCLIWVIMRSDTHRAVRFGAEDSVVDTLKASLKFKQLMPTFEPVFIALETIFTPLSRQVRHDPPLRNQFCVLLRSCCRVRCFLL